MMKAVVYRKGKGLVYEQAPIPEPQPDQVLVELINTGFCGSDHSIIVQDYVPDGHILGHEVSGIVAKAGGDVDGGLVGTRVCVRPNYCGQCRECIAGRQSLCREIRRSIGTGDLPGGFAQYLVAYPDMLIQIPENVDSQNAALAEVYATSLHAIKLAGINTGSALVMGGGPIGLALVDLLGNYEFETICLSEPVASKRDLSLRMGATHGVDPLHENLADFTKGLTGNKGFDVIFECSGVTSNIQAAIDIASVTGVVAVVSVSLAEAVIKPISLLMHREISLLGSWSSTQEEIRQCLEWMSQGRLDGRPMISDLATLEELPSLYHEKIHPGNTVKVMLQIGTEF